MKVLVIRFSSIGDIVLTTPVVRCLKQQKAGVSVHFLTKSSFRSIVEHNPYVDKFYYLHDNLSPLIDELKKEKYDYVIDLHNNVRSLRVKLGLDTESYTFPKLNFRKWLLVNFKMNTMPDKSIVERYFETVKPLGIKNDTRGLDYFIPDTIKLHRNDVPMSHWHGYVACVIGGSYFTKKLPVSQWKKFCQVVPYPVILLGGPEDRKEGDEISEEDGVKIYNACGKFDLNEAAELLKHAKVVVSNDTGLMHIASAFQKPIISLWGNTAPEMGMFPYYGYNNMNERVSPKSVIFENKNIKCHPCSKLGYKKCPKGHFRCMNDLDMNDLAEKVKFFWKNPNQL